MKTSTLLKNAGRDYLTRHLPKSNYEDSFAFLVHPRDMRDVKQKYPFLKYFPEKISENFLAYFFWPIIVTKITDVTAKSDDREITGYVISIPMTARLMMKNRKLANRQIRKATILAEKLGAKNIGLGALTASLTRGGLDLVSEKSTAAITNGKLYTAKTVTDITINSSDELRLDKKLATIAIVGAAGSIGSASAQILAKNGYRNFVLIDLSDKKERVLHITQLLKKLNPLVNVKMETSLDALIESDIIIAATNKPEALIMSKHVKPGAIIVDDAQPSDVDMDILLKRDDVLVLEGGVVNTPGVNVNFEMGLKYKNDIFSCLAEVVILSYLENTDQSIGEVVEVNFEKLQELEKYSDELGFKRGQFQNSIRTYSEKDIDYIIKSKV